MHEQSIFNKLFIFMNGFLKVFNIRNLHEQGYISCFINFFQKCLWTRQLLKEYDVFSGRASPPLTPYRQHSLSQHTLAADLRYSVGLKNT